MAKVQPLERVRIPIGWLNNHAMHAALTGAEHAVVSFLSIDLTVVGPIVPGQPIAFFWTSTVFNGPGGPLDLGAVTATLYPVDANGDANQSFPLDEVSISGAFLTAGLYHS